MTLSEFKAWFEGYTEGLDAAPTKTQFDRIKEKVRLIDGAPIVQTVWLDYYRRYYPTYVPYWTPNWNGTPQFYGNAQGFQGAASASGSSNAYNNYATNSFKSPDSVTTVFNAQEAMYALGKAEAVN